ncbi:ComEC/Rec2 family competence protein [Aestuariivirga sp.]|uniref:ComEC/Rec2 family competence protein n=1 Tax=Aestuariivirga sp. TaxID=2650926 RepID=UPI00391CE7B7
MEAAAVALSNAAAAQAGRSFLWAAPGLAVGIGVYFGLHGEPSILLAGVAAALGAVLIVAGRNAPLLLLAATVALGFSLTKFRAERVATPLLAAATDEVRVSGRVTRLQHVSAKRLAMTLEAASIAGLAPERTPRLLRLSFAEKAGIPPVGAEISFEARLWPLPSPVLPGGFDHARALWFDGIGGLGRITSQIAVAGAPVTLAARLEGVLGRLRAAMGARIRASLEEPYASFAEALITGERSSIPPEVNRSLLVSGLFHILSISGLHMWLVAGGVFWGARALLALVPVLALRRPIKKWAAAAALAAGFFYLMLADSGVATARAFLMVAVVFFAVMVDRPALSTRNLAIAAFCLLVTSPEAAVEASFQMSFLAVLGLVAFYETWARWTSGSQGQAAPRRHWTVRLAVSGLSAFGLSLLTSAIAGAASSIPAAYHFGRISPYGVLANGAAIPVVGLVVMPAALVASLLMPFGLEGPALMLMGKGLQLVIAISDGVASLPGANAVVATPPQEAALTMAAGLVFLCLLRGPVRLSGLAVMALGAALGLRVPAAPDLLIERTGVNVAIRNAAGELVPAFARRGRFAVEKWLQANGEEASPAEAARRPGWTCDGNRCRTELHGRRILYLSRSEGAVPDCDGADVLIADFPLRGACRGVPLRIDRFDLWRSGAHAVWLGGKRPILLTSREVQGSRPWVVRPERRAKTFVPPEQRDDPTD